MHISRNRTDVTNCPYNGPSSVFDWLKFIFSFGAGIRFSAPLGQLSSHFKMTRNSISRRFCPRHKSQRTEQSLLWLLNFAYSNSNANELFLFDQMETNPIHDQPKPELNNIENKSYHLAFIYFKPK